ncbi:MAG: sulfotransferase [Nitrospirae bacterium]|nr:sulfotransferase [Nitrospirota bacterium]
MEISLEAELRDESRCELAKKTVRLLVSAEAEEGILAGLGSLSYPEEFDNARLSSLSTLGPVFVIGEHTEFFTAPVSALQCAFETKHFPALQHFQLLADLVTVTKNTWDDEIKGYFAHLGDMLGLYGIGHLDIYEIINEIRKFFCDVYDRQVVSSVRIDVLPGVAGLRLVPLIKGCYPGARFICVTREGPAGGRAERPAEANEVPAFSGVWGSVKKSLDDDQYLELDESYFTSDVKSCPAPLADFMKMNGAQRELFVVSLRRQAASSGAEVVSPDNLYGGDERLASRESPRDRYEFRLEKLTGFPEEKPIFVLGAGRSATSAMTGALMDGLNISGWHEGHVFPLLRQLLYKLFEKWREVAGPSLPGDSTNKRPPWFPENIMYDMLDAVVKKIVLQSKKDIQNYVWMDKTPDDRMVHCVDLLLHLFPHGRFIFLRRNPVPLALSRRRKFQEPPIVSFVVWAKCIDAWEKARTLLREGQFEEFDQRDLTRDTVRVVERLRKLIPFEEEERRRTMAYLTTERPEFTLGRIPPSLYVDVSDDRRKHRREVLFYNLLDYEEKFLEDTDWSGLERDLFLGICGERGTKYGYSFHRGPEMKQYFIADVAARIESLQYTAEEKIKDIAHLTEQFESCRKTSNMYRRLYERRTAAYWMRRIKARLRRVAGPANGG